MANNSSPKAASNFDLRFMEKGKHSVALYLPPDYHAEIGQIIAHWGNFEILFDKILEALIAGEKNDGIDRSNTSWEKQKFRNRKTLFISICNNWLSNRNPEEAKAFKEILTRASDLHWRRNMIAHGSFSYSIPAKSSDAVNCKATSKSTGKEMPFDEKVLKKIYHDISHITAEMAIVFQGFGVLEGLPFMILPDAELQRVYRETSHPWHPNLAKRTPLP